MAKSHRPDRRGGGRGGRSDAPPTGARPPQTDADTPRRSPGKSPAAATPGQKTFAPRGSAFDKPPRERTAGPPRDGRRPDGAPQGKPYRARPGGKPPGGGFSDRPPASRPQTDRPSADRPSDGRGAPKRLRSERSSEARPAADRRFDKPSGPPGDKYRGKGPSGPRPEPGKGRTPDRTPPPSRGKPPRPQRQAEPAVDEFALWDRDEAVAPTASSKPAAPRSDDDLWVYGNHATIAALANPRRRIRRLVALADAAAGLNAALAQAKARLPTGPLPEIVSRGELEDLLPSGAVHQGVALAAAALPPGDIEDVVAGLAEPGGASQIVVLLDQVTDPHNIGAIMRSAAAFGALALVLPEHGAPDPTGTLAKAASGALELVPLIRVVNLARTLDRLKEAGFWCVGLDEAAPQTLAQANLSGRVALVLGAEGDGMRRLTRERCDLLVRLPTTGALASLNVSNAAAIALYELTRG